MKGFVMCLMGGTGSGNPPSGGNPLLGFLPLLLILVVMYMLMIRPQSKRQKEHRSMLEKLEKGDKILTAGGIIGKVEGIKETENILIVKIAENVKIEITRSSVAQVLTKRAE